jgi:hypothetical protein
MACRRPQSVAEATDELAQLRFYAIARRDHLLRRLRRPFDSPRPIALSLAQDRQVCTDFRGDYFFDFDRPRIDDRFDRGRDFVEHAIGDVCERARGGVRRIGDVLRLGSRG